MRAERMRERTEKSLICNTSVDSILQTIVCEGVLKKAGIPKGQLDLLNLLMSNITHMIVVGYLVIFTQSLKNVRKFLIIFFETKSLRILIIKLANKIKIKICSKSLCIVVYQHLHVVYEETV